MTFGRWHATDEKLVYLALTALSATGFMLNEYLGPVLIGVAMVGWAAVAFFRPALVWNALRNGGAILWIVPLVAIVSILWSQDPMTTTRTVLWLCVSTLFGIIPAALVSRTEFLVIFALSAFGPTFASLFINRPWVDGMSGITSYGGIYGNKNTLGTMATILVLSSLAVLLRQNMPRLARLLSAGGIAIGLTLALLSRSVGITLTMFVVAVVPVLAAILARSPRALRKSLIDSLTIASVVAGAASAVIVALFKSQLLALLNKDETLTGRTWLWAYAENLIADDPWFGTGYQAFWLEGSSHAEFILRFFKTRGGFHFHNLFYELSVEIGLVGAVLAMFVLLTTLVTTFRAMRRDTNSETGFFLAFALLAVVMDMNAVNLFMPFNITYLIVVAAYCFARRTLREPVTEGPVQQPIRRGVSIRNDPRLLNPPSLPPLRPS